MQKKNASLCSLGRFAQENRFLFVIVSILCFTVSLFSLGIYLRFLRLRIFSCNKKKLAIIAEHIPLIIL